MASNKDVTVLRKRLVAQGFEVERARNGHWRVTAPDGRKAQFPYSPSDHRSMLNVKARLRRIGYLP